MKLAMKEYAKASEIDKARALTNLTIKAKMPRPLDPCLEECTAFAPCKKCKEIPGVKP